MACWCVRCGYARCLCSRVQGVVMLLVLGVVVVLVCSGMWRLAKKGEQACKAWGLVE